MAAPHSPKHRCLAVCAPGLEELTAGELAGLGIGFGRRIAGGVIFRASTRQLYAANLWSRTATRVLVRVGSFQATTFASLEERAREIEWHNWIGSDAVPTFRVSATKSRLYHTGAIAERLERVAGGSRGGGVSESDRTQGFVVRVNHDKVTISVNSSGAPLYQRGWRGPQGKAPVRETLAAALLLAAGWDGTQPLVDPMCGSGTIPIEAALIARGLAPGWQRSFAFGDWPSFEPGTWASVAADAAKAARPGLEVPILASDRDAGAVDATAINAERAGVVDSISVLRRSLSEVHRPGVEPGWLITNPPYGKRASGATDLRNLYARLGQVAKRELEGWSVGLLVADRNLAGHAGLPFEERLHTTNGGLDVCFLTTKIRRSPPAA